MKLVFAGTPEFAAQALEQMLRSGLSPALVLTRPDRPAGRGLKATASAVKELALRRGLELLQPHTLKETATLEKLKQVAPEVMVVAAYGLILPKTILELPHFGCINIHASLLPKWRGAAPIQRALLAGDAVTGITIMQMDEGLDTGPVLLQQRLQITDDDTGQTLHDKLARLGGECIVRTLQSLERGELRPQRQPQAGASYATKVEKAEAEINWGKDARLIERMVRAFNPYPGASTQLNGQPLKIWKARVENHVAGKPGEVMMAKGRDIIVACGTGGLRIEELQKAGSKRLPAQAFLTGSAVKPGVRFGA
ncbi:MAG: methionyl-tRNA formyltransferase [Burkholderiales bacterium]